MAFSVGQRGRGISLVKQGAGMALSVGQGGGATSSVEQRGKVMSKVGQRGWEMVLARFGDPSSQKNPDGGA